MKILLANKFFYGTNGAEKSFFQTAKLLKDKGHRLSFFSMKDKRNVSCEYEKYFVKNIDYNMHGIVNKISPALKMLYSFEAKDCLSRLLDDEVVDLAHLNNIYHQISPSIIHTLKKRNIPVVMSLRDYKVVCASYLMMDRGRVCEACAGGRYGQCLERKCVRHSFLKSALSTVEMYLHHKLLHIYDLVDVFISPSLFLKEKVMEMGFKGKVVHIPNFIYADDFKPCYGIRERSICYLGRLSKEKGLVTLIKAVKGMDLTLKIIGDGPSRVKLEALILELGIKNVRLMGCYEGAALHEEIRSSMFSIIPSEWYENNPRSVIEAFALGKPVIGARIGGIPELVMEGVTGYLFEPGNVDDLRAKIEKLIDDPAAVDRMGRAARVLVDRDLNPEVHYEKLMRVYAEAGAVI